MEISFKSAVPAQNYARPAIRLTFCLKYGRTQEAPTHISGEMAIHDKIIGILNLETPLPASSLQALRYKGQQRELGEISMDITMVSVLDRHILDLIEHSRRENKKGDVEFRLNISVNYLSNLAELSHVVALPLEIVPFSKQSSGETMKALALDPQRTSVELLFHAYQNRDYYQNNSNLQFIVQNANAIGNNQGVGYLTTETLVRDFDERIHSSDWINDFSPALGLGEFFVVEIPTGNKTLEDAWNLLSKAEESFRRWNLEGVISSCRLVGQNLDGFLKKRFDTESFTYRERWERIYGSGKTGFTGWLSMPLHSEEIKNEGTGGHKYEKSQVIVTEADAEAILLTTKTLIKYAEKLVNEGQ